MRDKEDRYTGTFSPHLWRQRRMFILEMLQRFKKETVLDYGCGEATVLSYLIPPNEHPITKIAGIDICDQVLEEALDSCTPWQSDFDQLRDHPLVIDIYKGSIGIPDDRFKGFQAIICTEVIEHVYPEVLDSFLGITLGIYQPELMIVTTPNAEYNVNFPDLKYGTSEFEFRHDDHIFEWTRAEFESWCNEGAKKYGYHVEYHGIGLLHGKYDDLENGHCTQACIFTRPSTTTKKQDETSYGNPHELIKHIEFPYYNEPKATPEKIHEELLHYIEVLCVSETLAREDIKLQQSLKPNTAATTTTTSETISIDHITDWSTLNLNQHIPDIDLDISTEEKEKTTHTSIPLKLPVSSLWVILNLRQMCRTKETLLNSISCLDKEEYELMDNETLVVKKSFPLDLDEDNHSASTFSSHNS